jgi:hypothetical protein
MSRGYDVIDCRAAFGVNREYVTASCCDRIAR